MFIILLVKLLSWAGSLIGRGSSLPGTIALKLCPNILKKLVLPEKIIAVTGSNGKTGTCGLITQAAEAAGMKVLSNRKGSNQKEGVTTLLLTNANPFTKKVDADLLVLESDERFCQYTFRDITPSYIVITNLYRDQLTRNGHSEFVKGELLKGLPEKSVLILNANEPMAASCGAGRDNNIYYSVSATGFDEEAGHYHAYNDGAVCPVCMSPMDYSRHIAGQVGEFKCGNCGFGGWEAAHSVTDVTDDGGFVIDGRYEVRPQLCNTNYAQNIAAVFTVCVEAAGMDPARTAEYLNGIELDNGRTVTFELGGHEGLFILCKHENSMAYNAAIETALASDREELTVTFIVDRLSRKYVANDMSWLWDIDFERLQDDRVKKIVLSGGFAHDLAARLLCAGISSDRLAVVPDLDEMMTELTERARGSIYVFTCFTDQNKFLSRLKKAEEEKK